MVVVVVVVVIVIAVELDIVSTKVFHKYVSEKIEVVWVRLDVSV